MDSEPGPLQRFVTVSVAVVVRVSPPLTPVIVSVKVPFAPDTVCTLIVDVVVAGFEVNVTLDLAGLPLMLRVTDPLKPLLGVMVTV